MNWIIRVASPVLLFTVLVGLIVWNMYPQEIIIEVPVVSNEGEAKAQMIYELTGLELQPEVAKWATVSFSGTTVSIETHNINLWDGKKWR